MTNISLIHLNEESDGDINKTFITYAQQQFKVGFLDHFYYITFFRNQSNLKDQNPFNCLK